MSDDTPRPVGRPTLYKPEYCQQVKDFCAQGLSLTAFAGEIEVARSTIAAWMEENEEFRVACKVAINKRAAFHERRMNEREATGPMVTASRFALVNATLKDEPKDWSEKLTQEHQGPDGKPLNTGPTIIFSGSPPGASAPETVASPSDSSD